MPIYEYRCERCGHELEKLQKLAEDPPDRVPGLRRADLEETDLRRRLPAQGRRLVRDRFQDRREEEPPRRRREGRGRGEARRRREKDGDRQARRNRGQADGEKPAAKPDAA